MSIMIFCFILSILPLANLSSVASLNGPDPLLSYQVSSEPQKLDRAIKQCEKQNADLFELRTNQQLQWLREFNQEHVLWTGLVRYGPRESYVYLSDKGVANWLPNFQKYPVCNGTCCGLLFDGHSFYEARCKQPAYLICQRPKLAGMYKGLKRFQHEIAIISLKFDQLENRTKNLTKIIEEMKLEIGHGSHEESNYFVPLLSFFNLLILLAGAAYATTLISPRLMRLIRTVRDRRRLAREVQRAQIDLEKLSPSMHPRFRFEDPITPSPHKKFYGKTVAKELATRNKSDQSNQSCSSTLTNPKETEVSESKV